MVDSDMALAKDEHLIANSGNHTQDSH